MITSDNTIRPFKVRRFAVLDAMWHYGELKKVWIWGVVCFWIDLVDYLVNGFVVVRPDLFWMMRIVNIAPEGEKPEPAWYVRMCVGDLNELLATMPVVLPKIVFTRRSDPRVRIYSTEKLIMKAKGIRE